MPGMLRLATSMPNIMSMVHGSSPSMARQRSSERVSWSRSPSPTWSLGSEKFSLAEALSWGGHTNVSPGKAKHKDNARGDSTPPLTFWPKAGPSTATRVTVKKTDHPVATSKDAQKEARVAAIKKVLEQCLETARKTSRAGNKVSGRMMEYVTMSNKASAGLRPLANGLLDNCKLLVEVEAGLANAVREGTLLRAKPVEEVEACIKKAMEDFTDVDSLLERYVDCEKKGSGRRMKLTRRKGLSDKDLGKQLGALVKTKLRLREAIDGLTWEDASSTMMPPGKGPGYTGLAAVLNRLGTVAVSPAVTLPAEKELFELSHSPTHKSKGSNAKSSPTDLRLNSPSGRPKEPTCPLPPLPSQSTASPLVPFLLNRDITSVDPRCSTTTSGSSSARHLSSVSSRDESYEHDSDPDDFTCDSSPEIVSPNIVRIKVDPSTIPRHTPKQLDKFAREHHHGSLCAAIRAKNRKLVEKLLDRGVSAGASSSSHPLNEAIAVHDEEIVRQLLLFGANPNEADINGVTPLHAAMNENHLPSAVNLLKHAANPHYVTASEPESPLARAVRVNSTGFLHCLLIYGGSVRHVTSDGETLLISAMNANTPQKAVEMLLEYGADPNGKTIDGRTPLHEAISLGRLDLMAVLLDKGALPNLPGPNHMLWTAVDHLNCLPMLLAAGADPRSAPGILEFAASSNSVEAVRLLLKSRADPDAKSGDDTPLCTAIRDNRQEIFQLLVNHGADPNVKADIHPAAKCVMLHRAHFLPALKAAGADLENPRGLLEMAVAFKNMEALKWLLETGLNPDEKSPKGYTALTTAIRDNRLDMVNLLLAHGADPNVRGQDWPLCMAVRNPIILKRVLKMTKEPRAFKGVMEMAAGANQLESVKLLLKAGVSPEDRTSGLFSPLTTAIRDGRTELATYLVEEAKVDVNAPGEQLPLVMAVRAFDPLIGDMEILEMLLDRGADPNLVYQGRNAAIEAMEKGDLEVLKLLCEESQTGVDWQVKDEKGRSVMQLAKARGWDKEVGLLRRVSRRK